MSSPNAWPLTCSSTRERYTWPSPEYRKRVPGANSGVNHSPALPRQLGQPELWFNLWRAVTRLPVAGSPPRWALKGRSKLSLPSSRSWWARFARRRVARSRRCDAEALLRCRAATVKFRHPHSRDRGRFHPTCQFSGKPLARESRAQQPGRAGQGKHQLPVHIADAQMRANSSVRPPRRASRRDSLPAIGSRIRGRQRSPSAPWAARLHIGRPPPRPTGRTMRPSSGE